MTFPTLNYPSISFAFVFVVDHGGGGIEGGEVPSKSARENVSVIQLL